MAILTADALAGANTLNMNNETWANARGSTIAEGTGLYAIQCNYIGTDNYTLARTFLWFDTSSIGAGSTITAAKLVHPAIGNNTNGDTITVHVVGHTAAGTTIALEDYDQIGNTSYGSILMSGLSTSTTTDITLNATGLAAINKTGNTAIGIRCSRDLDNSAPTGTNEYTTTLANFDLVVTYTPPSAEVAGHFHFM